MSTIYISNDLKENILSEAPSAEPDRQYFFIEECRRLVSRISQQKGRPLKACINTFGCQMNAKDSEKLCGIMKQIGYELTGSEEADFVLYNTCTVREHAAQRVYGRLGVLKNKTESNPDMVVAVCGCMMQEEAAVEKIKNSYRHVNIIFGTYNIYRLAELLFKHLCDGSMQVEVLKHSGEIVENLPAKRSYKFKSGVNIMYGCNNFCSYCIVPYVRGRERSRKPDDVLDEIRRLADDGVIEVMLLGQNVNSYEYDFPALLDAAAKVEGIKRVRFMTSHPKDLSDELICTIRDNPVICRHIHLPLQSGSSRILKAMNRHYDKEGYLALAEKIRGQIPDVSITTDIIVGFPGESDEDFAQTLDVVNQVKFDSAFTFIYSKRSGTKAADMPSQVPKEVCDERFKALLELVSFYSRQQTLRHEGKVMEALVEERNPKDSRLVTGRLSNNSVVHFPGTDELTGKIVKVRLEQAKGFYYIGSLTDDD